MTTALEPSGDGFDLGIWLSRRSDHDHEDAHFAGLARELARLQAVVAGTAPPPEISQAAATNIAELRGVLERYPVDERAQPAGRQYRDPQRGQTFTPPLSVEEYDGTSVRARVTFDRFYLGSNGAVHGGAIALVFDDILGQLANAAGYARARTAFLRVDFRSIVPIVRELEVVAAVTRVEGRKLFIDGEIKDGEQVLSHAQGLFVRLVDGQP